jgi:VanZ family protein
MPHEKPSPLARYLFLAYVLLVVYASLHPFTGWRDRGLPPFSFLTAPFPRPFLAFDLVANIIGYVPLGFLAVLAVYPALRRRAAFVFALALAFLLSFALESLQLYLPTRTSSNLDLVANTAGGVIGALSALAASRRLLDEEGLNALRNRLFLPGGMADLGLVLLGLWLLAQLNPETLLFGTGDLRWLFQAPPGKLYPAEFFLRVETVVTGTNVVAVGLLLSCLTTHGQPTRVLIIVLLSAALAVHSFAFGLLVSSQDVLSWVTPGGLYGVIAGIVLLTLAVVLPRMAQLALADLALITATALVNLAPANPYKTAALALWQQGHFFNLNGVTRVVSAAWPFVATCYLVVLAAMEREHRKH